MPSIINITGHSTHSTNGFCKWKNRQYIVPNFIALLQNYTSTVPSWWLYCICISCLTSSRDLERVPYTTCTSESPRNCKNKAKTISTILSARPGCPTANYYSILHYCHTNCTTPASPTFLVCLRDCYRYSRSFHRGTWGLLDCYTINRSLYQYIARNCISQI